MGTAAASTSASTELTETQSPDASPRATTPVPVTVAYGDAIDFDRVLDLLGAMHGHGWDVIKTEHLYTFDGRRAYSLGQGE